MAIIKKGLYVPREYGRNKRIMLDGSGVTSSGVGGGGGSWLEAYFFIDSNDNLTVNTDLFSQGEIAAFVGVDPPAPNWWDSMPIASDTILGGIKVGTNLTIDENGVLNASGGSGTADWGSISGTLSDQTDLWTQLQLKYSSTNNNIGAGATNYAAGNHLHTGVYEPSFSKNSGFNLNLGIATGTVSEGDHNHNTLYLGITDTAADSELLDGINSSSFLRTSGVQEISATLITSGQFNSDTFGTHTGDYKMFEFNGTDEIRFGDLDAIGSEWHLVIKASGSPIFRNDTDDYIIWTEESMGVGSGMNADLLDGYHASIFPRKAENATISGLWNFTGADTNFTQSVMIGSSSAPSEALEIIGSALVSSRYKISTQWSIGLNGTDIVFFNSGGTRMAKIDQSGNLIAAGDVTAYGTV